MNTITIYVENRIGILEKIASVFTRNRVNIESLLLKDKQKIGLSSIAINTNISSELVKKLLPQLRRIIEVAEVSSSEIMSGCS